MPTVSTSGTPAPHGVDAHLLARWFAEAVGRAEVGIDQDLFAAGADSLAAIQLLARVEEACGVELGLDDLFDAPTARRLAAVLATRQAAGAAAVDAEPLLAALPRVGPIPLSFAQRRLWFLHQADPLNPVHNLAAAVRLSGGVRGAVLAAVYAEIVRRHEVLRTAFAGGNRLSGEPEQLPLAAAAGPPPRLPLADLAALPRDRRAGAARAAARAIGRQPFDLGAGKVVRAALLRLGAQGDEAGAGDAGGGEHGERGTHGGECDDELVLAVHHIAADGAALAVLAEEIAVLYGAFAAGLPSPLPAPALRYADYAVWQRRRLDGAALAPGIAWWRERLAGAAAPLELPADRPRPAALSHRGAHHERSLGAGTARRLEELARRERTTPWMVLLAGFAALLARWSGATDVVIGSPVAGRQRRPVERLVGIFLNNLVLRLDLAGGPGLRTLAARVRDAALGAFAHQEVPFERLVEELRPPRDRSRNPLFQIMFVGQNAPLVPFANGGLRFAPREVDLGTARFDLSVSMAPAAEQGWTGTWKFSSDLFDAATVARLAGHFEALLGAALAAPDAPFARLPLLSPPERHQVGLAWNDTAASYPLAGRLLHAVIAEQAARTPGAVAVQHGAQALTYEELLRRAAALAATLRGLGVGPETRVGIAAERSLGMIAALLGTLMAGAAYLPLDPDYPAERLAYMLDDAAAGALVAPRRLMARLGGVGARLAAAGRLLELDEEGAAGEGSAAGEAGGEVEAGELAGKGDEEVAGTGVSAVMAAVAAAAPGGGVGSAAYVIYTSGSTGQPKGAVVPHSGIVNRLLWMQEAYGLGPHDRVLQKTPFSFDVSVWELFWPLMTGARLVMAPPGVHQDPGRLLGLIAEHGITTLHFVPSLLQVFLDQPGVAAACASLRRVFASGEALPFDLQERFFATLPGVELHNLYGPTEASVDVSFHACRGDGVRPVPIGRPIANVEIVLLDREMEPAPAGVPGELHIGGAGLARGYLGRPGLTAERFVPDPAGRRVGGRLYKTGDLARWRPDGEVEFLGRLDHQVKVRGVRVELGEIEAALLRHPAVREAVVVAWRGGSGVAAEPGGARLVAYLVVAAGGAAPVAAELRAFLGRSLPEALVPAVYVTLPALPLTPSGKVDRQALPAPAAAAAPGDGERGVRTEPRTALERRLAALWSEHLAGAAVGADDSFFALGGDSIQGAMLVNRLQHDLGAVVYVMALFDFPTPARFAAHLEESYGEALEAAGWATARPAGPAAGGAAGCTGGVEARQEPPAALTGEAAWAWARDTRERETGDPQAGARELADREVGDREAAVEAGELAALQGYLAGRFSAAGDGGARGGAAGAALPAGAERRNRPAMFILSPFRSGSTLLRVMLAGHPRLFAPPELELLGFTTMGERRRILAGRDAFAREGLVRAVMELAGCDADTAAARMDEAEGADEPIPALYRRLQEWAGERLLVDKTPRYSLDRATLGRAEAWFERPLYIHLVRHPAATMCSYLEARMDEVYRMPLQRDRQAEMVWRLAHRNILELESAVPAGRWLRLRFEDLLREPRAAAERICGFLGLPFDAALLSPYEGERMTGGLHRGGRMMGDPNFARHRRIEASVAERWRGAGTAWRLGEASWQLAERLGYARPLRPLTLRAVLAGAEGAASPAGAAGGDLPLSFAQQRLWFMDRLLAGGVYNMPAAIRLSGALDRLALAVACSAIGRRHAVLRTVFPAVEGRPRQAVLPPSRVRVPLIDLAALPAAPRDAAVARLLGEEARRPFDLATGPPWRVGLLRLAADHHVLTITLHHIVCDGWSVGVLTRELAALYQAARAGATASPAVSESLEGLEGSVALKGSEGSKGSAGPERLAALPELPLQYTEFAAWQRRRLSGDFLDEQLSYWRRRLAGPLPVLALPADRPRPAVATHRGARLAFAVPPRLTAELRRLATGAESTLFIVLAAAFQALLRRYTGQDDVLIGTPVAGRNSAEIEGLIGVFVNTLVLRTELGGDPSWQDLLTRVREACLGALRHQEVPFEVLVEHLGIERSLAHSPLFVAMLALQNALPAEIALPGLAAERLAVPTGIAKFELTFDLAERRDGGLAGEVEYNTDLFDAVTAKRLAQHFVNVLAAIAASAASAPIAASGATATARAATAPPRRLSELSLLSAAEEHWLRYAVNDTFIPLAEATLQDLFAATVRRRPQAVAVAGPAQRLTYAELARRSGRLARRLAALGVGPEVPVAICAERSPALVAAVLAILAAGGAYLPLDPTHPAERLAYILADSAAPVLVTEKHLLAVLPAHGARVLLLDDEPDGEPEEPDGAAPLEETAAWRRALPEGLAYVIYTSGSTGRPKGVEVRRRGLLNCLASVARRPGLGEGDVMMALTTLTFDIAVTELLLPLVVGARIAMPEREAATDAARLAAALEQSAATAMQGTPATWALLLDGGWQGRPGLMAISGGEALPRQLADRLLARTGSLWNLYGPTEATVWATTQRLAAGEGHVAIGRPLENTAIHLLGPHGELVPAGAAGELAIGGDGLARGYRGRPALTAERFVPDPFGAPGGRLYRSGDLARRLADGSLECLGRIDQQVKLRGVRIETGEIEAVLLEHAGVLQCAVAVRGERQTDRRLVAYVVAAPAGGAAREDLRAFLKDRLPQTMVPAAFVFLDRLPLSPSGKVDRRSLPDPGSERPDLAAGYAAPQNERQRQIAQIWQEVLRLDQVGIEDNFFDLGGHSLLAAEVQGKMRDRLGMDVALLDLFQHPTVRALASRLSGPAGPPGTPGTADAAPAALREQASAQREALHRRRRALARMQGPR
jgi:amino acid adenylation domain-containing protein